MLGPALLPGLRPLGWQRAQTPAWVMGVVGVGIQDMLLDCLLNPHCFLPLPHPLFPRPGCPASHPQLILEASLGGLHGGL